MRSRMAVLLVALAGCGGTAGDSDPDAGTSDAAMLAKVTGIVGIHKADGVFVPIDVSGEGVAAVSALVEVSPGLFETHLAIGYSDGTFVIEGVPEGPYLLRYIPISSDEPRFVATDARFTDLSWEELGRSDEEFATDSEATGLTFAVDGLAPWAAGDELFLSWNGRALPDWLFATMPPVAGSTTYVDETWAWRPRLSPLIDASRGDQALMAQYGSPAGFPDRFVMSRFAALPPIMMQEGVKPLVTATLAPVAQAHLDVEWRPTEFAAFASRLIPDGVSTHLSWAIYGPALLPLLRDQAPTPADGVVSLDYGDPLPAGARRVFYASFGASAADYVHSGSVSVIMDLADVAAGAPVRPILGPVENARIGGGDAFVPRSGVGLTPTLTWDAPSLGIPAGYEIWLMRRTWEGGTHYDGHFTTTTRELTIPPNILVPGQTYIAGIVANAGDDPARPFSRQGHQASASISTADFTP